MWGRRRGRRVLQGARRVMQRAPPPVVRDLEYALRVLGRDPGGLRVSWLRPPPGNLLPPERVLARRLADADLVLAAVEPVLPGLQAQLLALARVKLHSLEDLTPFPANRDPLRIDPPFLALLRFRGLRRYRGRFMLWPSGTPLRARGQLREWQPVVASGRVQLRHRQSWRGLHRSGRRCGAELVEDARAGSQARGAGQTRRPRARGEQLLEDLRGSGARIEAGPRVRCTGEGRTSGRLQGSSPEVNARAWQWGRQVVQEELDEVIQAKVRV
mmetsp:Transcript_87155/g.247113  ORF Transcript_87155/g.247113 Transcript_87155/m.247113 type:complete len:271 (+) Transcript_87155:299-1111(+)